MVGHRMSEAVLHPALMLEHESPSDDVLVLEPCPPFVVPRFHAHLRAVLRHAGDDCLVAESPGNEAGDDTLCGVELLELDPLLDTLAGCIGHAGLLDDCTLATTVPDTGETLLGDGELRSDEY